jgi:hypothetical protein
MKNYGEQLRFSEKSEGKMVFLRISLIQPTGIINSPIQSEAAERPMISRMKGMRW